MIALHGAQKFPLRRLSSAAPQFRQHYRRRSRRPAARLHSLAVAARPQVVNKDGGVEEDQVTHRIRRTTVFPGAFSSSP